MINQILIAIQANGEIREIQVWKIREIQVWEIREIQVWEIQELWEIREMSEVQEIPTTVMLLWAK